MTDANVDATMQSVDSLLASLALYVEKHGPTVAEYDDISALFDKLVACNSPTHVDAIRNFVDRSNGAFNTTKTNQGFVCARPHGYFGDFEIIERIYEAYISEDPTLKRWDEYFHWSSAPRAVRARKDFCVELLSSRLDQVPGTLSVLNVASGPCRDIYEFMSGLSGERRERMRIHCIDQDANAIRFAKARMSAFQDIVTFENRNVFRAKLTQQYHLVWSAGLFDYLDDRIFIRLVSKLAAAVLPGGELVIGNFSNRNRHRSYMEFGGWKLIHRDEDELISLAKESKIQGCEISVAQEPNGVNLFMHIKMPSQPILT